MATINKIPKCPPLRFPDFNDDWKETTLGEIASFCGGGTPSSEIISYWNGHIPWISSSDISTKSISNINTTRFISEEALSSSATKLCKAPCIVIVSRVGVGKLAYSENDICTSQDFCNMYDIKGNYIFMSYRLLPIMNKKSLEVQGTSIKGITMQEIKSLLVSLPSLAEQKKIADFLSLIDERIQSSIETLKERKREKAGLLNQLFSQKLRFPDFNDEWTQTTLGEILSLAPQIPIDKPCIKDIISVKLHGKGISRTSATTLNLGATQYYLRRAGQLIYGKQNFHNGAIALIPKEYDNGISSKDIPSFVFDTTKSSPKYVLAYLLRVKYYEATEIYTTGTGSKRLKEDSFFALPISLPTLEEQKKIADFLSLIDERIEVEEQLLQQYEKQKRYLLRQMFV